jgi:hypothetical protein
VLIWIMGRQRQVQEGAWPFGDMLSSERTKRKSYAPRTLLPHGGTHHKTNKKQTKVETEKAPSNVGARRLL